MAWNRKRFLCIYSCCSTSHNIKRVEEYIFGVAWHTSQPKNKKIKINPPRKKFLIFREIYFLALTLKISYTFPQKSFSYIFSKEGFSYISGNGTLCLSAQAQKIKKSTPGKFFTLQETKTPKVIFEEISCLLWRFCNLYISRAYGNF